MHEGAFVNGVILFYFMKKSGRSRTARSLRVAGLGEKRGNVLLRLGDSLLDGIIEVALGTFRLTSTLSILSLCFPVAHELLKTWDF
jgi:hypothetical protein